MGQGYLIHLHDPTTCGGRVISASDKRTNGVPVARMMDLATCGVHGGSWPIIGGVTGIRDQNNGQPVAGSLDSVSSCPCKARFIPQIKVHRYISEPSQTPGATSSSVAEPVQHAQAAKGAASPSSAAKTVPEALPLPARIYTTQRAMDDYDAKDMHYRDLSEDVLKERFGLRDISAKVNPYTLTLIPDTPVSTYGGFYPGGLTEKDKPVVVSRDESAALMFDEFRELAKVFSFHGPYKDIITEMITHMQENSGRPYSNPLLDKALEEQIINDISEQSSLLKIKIALKAAINYEYGYIPRDEVYDLVDEKGNLQEINGAVLPKFDRQIDKTNGLVITVHDTWATHITLESLEVKGDSYRAKVHYRVQDHFGLDDADIQSPVYRIGRIFRIWFVLQRYIEYGYRPFITEMNATVEISGRRGE